MDKTVQELIRNKTVVRSNRRTLGMELNEGGLLVRAPRFASKRDIDRFAESNVSWIEKQLLKRQKYRKKMEDVEPLGREEINAIAQKAASVIPGKVAYYAEKIGVSYNRITIRCQKTRWGSCSAAGNLNFNCLLMLAPEEVLESVIVHELCHRKEMNHSDRFYSEVLRVYPDYKKWNKWLKDNGKVLMARAGYSK